MLENNTTSIICITNSPVWSNLPGFPSKCNPRFTHFNCKSITELNKQLARPRKLTSNAPNFTRTAHHSHHYYDIKVYCLFARLPWSISKRPLSSAATPERTPKLGAYIRHFVIQIQLDDRDVRRVDNLDPLLLFTSLNSFFGMEGPIVHNPGDYELTRRSCAS